MKSNLSLSQTQKIVGERVRIGRKLKRLNQLELGNLIGHGRKYIYQIEKGKININIKTLYNLSQILEIPIYQFLCEEKLYRESERFKADSILEIKPARKNKINLTIKIKRGEK